jgi:hypothetical protein
MTQQIILVLSLPYMRKSSFAFLLFLFFISCKTENEQVQIEQYRNSSYRILDSIYQIPEDRVLLTKDSLNNHLVRFIFKEKLLNGNVSEVYFFNYKKDLLTYCYYNGFQKNNPLIGRIDFLKGKNGLDSLNVKGYFMSYRIFLTDSSDILNLDVASPVFCNTILRTFKYRDYDQSFAKYDTLDINSSLYSFGVLLDDSIRVKYLFRLNLNNQLGLNYQDSLLFQLPLVR